MPQNIFSPNTIEDQVYLRDFADQRVWVAWKTETRPANKQGTVTKTKPPYYAVGRRSKSDDPATWLTLQQALNVSVDIGDDVTPGGCGIMLGVASPLDANKRLGGIDLDACLVDGILQPWAVEIAARFNSYAEVSPSETGIKVFFVYHGDDLARLQAAGVIPLDQFGTAVARRTGMAHPPSIEFYLSRRYFTVTGNRECGVVTFPDAIRRVSYEDLLWLVNEAMPAFAPIQGDNVTLVGDRPVAQTPSRAPASFGSDKSRSAIAFRSVIEWRQSAEVITYGEMKERLLADAETAAWTREKGLASGARELRRMWQRTTPFAGSIGDIRADLRRESEKEAAHIELED